MLYTGKEIAEKYSTETIKLTEKNIRSWANKGLKHIRGPHNNFLYKLEWVDEYLEEQATINSNTSKANTFLEKKKEHKRKTINKCDFENCKVV